MLLCYVIIVSFTLRYVTLQTVTFSLSMVDVVVYIYCV